MKHRRTVECVTEDASVVVDDLSGAGEHEMRLHWLLPDLPYEVLSASPFCATFSSEKGRFRWNIFSSSYGNAAIIRAGKNLSESKGREDEDEDEDEDERLLGWESPTYGELCPAISLLYRARAPLPIRLVTVMLADERLQLQESPHELVLSRDGARVYQVSLTPEQAVGVTG